MRFILIDRLLDFEKGKFLKAVKNLSLAEEYLKDHFPKKPVMPGVLMLEALVQAGAWLGRLTHDFNYSTYLLSEARTIRYGKFVSPGDTLHVHIEWKKESENGIDLVGLGTVRDETVISAKLKIKHFNLSETDPKLSDQDEKLKSYYRSLFDQIFTKEPVIA